MEVTPIKKIKVMLKGEASSFGYEGKSYKPGDMFMIEESKFVPYLMDKIEPKKEPKKEKKMLTKTEEMGIIVAKDDPLSGIAVATKDETLPVKELPKKKRVAKKAAK